MSIDTAYNARPARVRVPLCPPSWSLPRAVRAGLGVRQHPAEQLVERIAAALGVATQDIVLCSSGSEALTRALRQIRRSEIDEVVVATFNCPAVVTSVVAAGMHPVLCDIGPDIGMSAEIVEAAISPRTRAVVATHLFGYDAGIERLAALCASRGIELVDDAAQALGGHVSGRALGAWGDAGVVSFGRHKPLYAGGGGALVRAADGASTTNSAADDQTTGRWSALAAFANDRLRRLDDRLPRLLRLAGRPADDVATDLQCHEVAISQEDMSSAAISLACAAFDRWPNEVRRATDHHGRIASVLESWGDRVCPIRPNPPEAPANMFPLVCKGISRRELADQLAARGVESTWLYYPLHLVPRYARVARVQHAPVAEQRAGELLCIPVRASLADRHIDHLVTALDESISRCNPSRRATT